MTHIPMTKAVQIRKAVESGESIAAVASFYKIPEERVKGLCGKPAKKAPAKSRKKAPAKVEEPTAAAEENWEE